MNWEFFSMRRKLTLEKFVKDAHSLDDAKKLFKKKGINLPIDGALALLYADSVPAKNLVKEKVAQVSSSISTPSSPPAAVLPKTSVDYLELGVEPTKVKKSNQDDKDSDAKA